MQENKKIVHFINSFTELSGGVGVALQLLIRSYPEKSHEIVCLRDSGTLLDCEAAILEFDRSGPYSLSYSISLKKFLKEYDVDEGLVFHIHGLWSGMNHSLMRCLRKSKIPYVISLHGMLSPAALKRHYLLKKLMYFFSEKWLFSNARHIICLNETEVKAAKKILGERANNMVILPHPYRFTLQERDIAEIWDSKSTEKLVFLYLGRIHETKGIMDLTQEFKLLKSNNYSLNIVGPASNNDSRLLKEYSISHLGKINYLGPLYGKDKDKAYKEAHAVVLPSMTEGLPVSLIEAASYGLPLFATHQCNMPWIESCSAGNLFDYYNSGVKQMAGSIITMNYDDLREKGKNAYKCSKSIYETSIISRLLDQIYS